MSERMARLEEAQELVDALEGVHPDDLTEEEVDAVRTSLPTDPTLARIVELSLPWPWNEALQYVSASERQSAYWQSTYDRSKPRSEADRRRMQAMADAAAASRGELGTVERDGKVIPASAAVVAETMEGRHFPGARAVESGRNVLRRLRETVRP